MGESLGSESGSEVDSYGEMAGGELEGSVLGDSGTDVGSSGDMSYGNRYGNIE